MQPVHLRVAGYIGVHRAPNQRFKAQLKGKVIGYFDTAVDAAVAYARARAALEATGVQVGTCHPLRRPAASYQAHSDPSEEEEEREVEGEQLWAQCDACGKWRRLPESMRDSDELDEAWTCAMHPDPARRGCEVAEEGLEEEEEVEELLSEVNGLRLYRSVEKGAVPKNPTGAARFCPVSLPLRQHTYTPQPHRNPTLIATLTLNQPSPHHNPRPQATPASTVVMDVDEQATQRSSQRSPLTLTAQSTRAGI